VTAFLFLALCRIFELLALLARSREQNELEILVLRHELSVLRRQAPRPRYEPRDRALLGALSRALPRERWSAFAVRPETMIRWHRRLVARRWTS
jgi:putative transposase